ncbi:cyclin-dependent kinase 2-associated protein 1-like [Nasonia vitripennis]|uniref:Cyclin-dependent kinase 2-associated protein 1 n=1 Tax=Nasonia vitripennis TaxID=7425 RepID=A0A7M7QP45_NASVI|nr:cyclin-dependent kinase 2-associated protein 1-like [Nasonia vitripennis]
MLDMEESYRNMETQRKIAEPLLTIPKPKTQFLQQQPQLQTKISNGTGKSKYTELLQVIGEVGQHIRPSYAGHRGSAEKIRQGIIKARALVRECLIETERSSRQ